MLCPIGQRIVTVDGMVSRRNAPSLDAVVRALHAAFVEVLVAPAGLEVPISSVTLVDPDDLSAEAYTTAAATSFNGFSTKRFEYTTSVPMVECQP